MNIQVYFFLFCYVIWTNRKHVCVHFHYLKWTNSTCTTCLPYLLTQGPTCCLRPIFHSRDPRKEKPLPPSWHSCRFSFLWLYLLSSYLFNVFLPLWIGDYVDYSLVFVLKFYLLYKRCTGKLFSYLNIVQFLILSIESNSAFLYIEWCCSTGIATFSEKDQIINILAFVCSMVSPAFTHFSHCITKAAINNTSVDELGFGSIKLYLLYRQWFRL